jgi:hypothetical protein
MSIPTWDEVATNEFWQRIPTDLHEDDMRRYLGSNGDAIEARVSKLEAMAKNLLTQGFPGPSIVAAVAALEVMIQYFCVRPIVHGVLLSDQIASEVVDRIIGSRSSDQRQILVALLKPWGIELTRIVLPNGNSLWETIQTPVNNARKSFVHRGDEVSAGDAALAINCISAFRKEVVLKIAERLQFTVSTTGCWSTVIQEPDQGVPDGGQTFYATRDPFS